MQHHLRRVALYSHDAMGLGHLRRNLAIARAIVDADHEVSALVIAGAHEANAFPLPPRCELLTLPALRKDRTGHYAARGAGMSLRRLQATRSESIRGALGAFSPHVFIADKWPCGALGELEPALAELRARPDARCVLGLRDVLDEPAVVEKQWTEAGHERALREYFDAVWIYGDPKIYDALAEYSVLQGFRDRVEFTGYLGCAKDDNIAEAGLMRADLNKMTDRVALCLVGGGQDGAELARAFVASTAPSDMTSILVTGPFLPETIRLELESAVRKRLRTRLYPFCRAISEVIARADRIVTMGGYNAVCEILAAGKRPLVVPRVHPRKEQWIRAERLRAADVVDAIDPGELHPDLLSKWLASPDAHESEGSDRIDLGGMRRIPQLLVELASAPRRLGLEMA